MSAILWYDGDCPICRNYRDYVALRRNAGLELRDARQHLEDVRDLARRGVHIDRGMILSYDGRLYQGRRALVMLSALTRRRGWWDGPVRFLIRLPGFAHVAYPIAKGVRWLLMRALGRDPRIRA